ncbi:MAG: phosphotransferase [Gammaproteobacteria bacterium]|nr:phosphotransferase [Gammaproteobacteria bacterium]
MRRVEHWIRAAVESLHDSRSVSALSCDSFLARPLGRNAVWEVTERASQRKVCVKIWRDQVIFHREVQGRAIINNIASRRPRILPVTVLHTDEERGAIVTEWIEGVTLRHLLNAQLRYRIPLARTATAANRCFVMTVELLRELHCVDRAQFSQGADHSIGAQIERLNRNARELAQSPLLKDMDIFHAFPVQVDASQFNLNMGGIFGDLSPENVVYAGGKVGFWDFEDMGIGPTLRDYIYVDYFLGRMSRWRYQLPRAALQRLAKELQQCSAYTSFCRLELMLAHLALLAREYSNTSGLRRSVEWFDIKQLANAAQSLWLTAVQPILKAAPHPRG